jgi:glutamate synthase (NADPH/NADH) large chain/glutamate synthase (ferredoxin)
VASGRFGVTTGYLAYAEELEIKMAQGSKPGEGGQLPARKVTALIARMRHTTQGIPLISPPPHHDIYSIEDLAQLIFDLRQVNPRALIGVKLVAERGVGAVAAGVAKAHADYILVSGHDGGTGASPLSSIKHVGASWEVGLAETQQTLRRNGLRDRVRLRVDGGLKTGRDIIVAALLGAEEYGFGTAALISIGCDMARQCHLDTCPTGIATQREDLRQRFTGTPEQVANTLLLLAQDVREHLALLGARSLNEIIGRPDLLMIAGETSAVSDSLGLAGLIAPGPEGPPRRCLRDHDAAPTEASLDEYALLDSLTEVMERGHSVLTHQKIRNRDRTAGARLAGEIARRWGEDGLRRGAITCSYTGTAGQSFGAFCVSGLRLHLTGEANDYVAKGMSGGEIVVAPPTRPRRTAGEQVIIGNTALYGATGGLLLVRGRAGERFAVRNSGAVAVVEGLGDHGCEYMTGGVVLVLGPTGRNFAAAMSGGLAYVYDEDGAFPAALNDEMVSLERITDDTEAEAVIALLEYHEQMTHSDRAAALLWDCASTLERIWRVTPHSVDTQTHGAALRALDLALPVPALRPAQRTTGT